MIRPARKSYEWNFMTASAEEEVLVTVSETLGPATGKSS
jgi:hypothetical protein